jgi:hypothetical protein
MDVVIVFTNGKTLCLGNHNWKQVIKEAEREAYVHDTFVLSITRTDVRIDL